MTTASPFADLPAVVRALAPESDDCGPGEARADCARCPLTAAPAPPPWGFTAATRCCTHHPTLPSFLAGRALARGGATAARVLARLADPEGVSALGIGPPPGYLARAAGGAGFGHDLALRCPFWAGGDASCGIWADRAASCRSWFCKHDDGLGGAVAWRRLGDLVGAIEDRVARRLVELGTPPAADAAHDAATWARWYRWCAIRVETLTAAEVDARGLAERRDELSRIRRRPPRALADRLVPSVGELHRDGERVLLAGYSSYDAVAAPVAVFGFLARLDGATPWPEALAACPGLDAATVRELHRVGAVRAADGSDDLPFTVEPPPGAPVPGR